MVIRGTEIRRRDPAGCNLFPTPTRFRSPSKYLIRHPAHLRRRIIGASIERPPVVSHNPITEGGVKRYRSAAVTKEVGMSYRYNTLDVIVGVGMSAIMFGALLLFVATAGTFQGIVSSPAVMDQMSGDPTGMAWLQPPLGQAIVDGMLLERRTNRNYAEAVSEWNRATMAMDSLGSPFEAIATAAVSVPV